MHNKYLIYILIFISFITTGLLPFNRSFNVSQILNYFLKHLQKKNFNVNRLTLRLSISEPELDNDYTFNELPSHFYFEGFFDE